jgi:hypothetical protein
MPLFKTLLGIENLHYSVFKEPPGTGCDFHTTPARSILDDRPAVKVEELAQFLSRDRAPKYVLHGRFCHFRSFSGFIIYRFSKGRSPFLSLLFIATPRVFKKVFHQPLFQRPDFLRGYPDAVGKPDRPDDALVHQAIDCPVAHREIVCDFIDPVIPLQKLR